MRIHVRLYSQQGGGEVSQVGGRCHSRERWISMEAGGSTRRVTSWRMFVLLVFFFAKEMVNPEKLRRFYRFWNVRGLFAETALRRSSLCDCVGFIGSLRARLVIS